MLVAGMDQADDMGRDERVKGSAWWGVGYEAECLASNARHYWYIPAGVLTEPRKIA